MAQLVARTDHQLAVDVLFVQPSGAPADWTHTDLWSEASAIPGVHVAVDHDGHDATAFGATVSGQVELYDSQGNRLFSGGITDGRGHEGDNAGFESILALVRHQAPRVTATPVYGCTLLGCTKPAEGR